MRKKELMLRLGAAEEQIEVLVEQNKARDERIARLESISLSRANKPTKTATELKSEWWNGEKK